ncbi:efflux RND transporter periplasmic adaptor subunit [Verticiella sediminum]|uniref:efflux RND transporter periplasmic adaptor subunit n=1 Tax=Verticiella sediminum TaxID=1247510 RepID=UPI001478B734|nr:efflux RND transporter periplasmic adaptor subunit [Verticiella sediminum]
MLLLVLAVVALLAVRAWRGTPAPVYAVQMRPLVQDVVASGRVAARERARVGSEIAGVVIERPVREGEHVQSGQLLLRLRNDEWQARLGEAQAALRQLRDVRRPQAAAELREAEIAARQAGREALRRRDLARAGAIAREALEQAEQAADAAGRRRERASLALADLAAHGAEERVLQERIAVAQAALARTEIRAPFAGTLIARLVEAGDAVQPGTAVFDLVRDAATEIVVPIDEKFLGRLAAGQSATVIADAYDDRPFTARLERLAPGVDPQRGTVDAHLVPTPVPDFLREDMTVSATIHTARKAAALAVPHDALGNVANGRATVQVVRDGRVADLAVRLGLRGLLASEVIEGLQAGERVLAAPLPVGTRVRPVEQAWGDEQ